MATRTFESLRKPVADHAGACRDHHRECGIRLAHLKGERQSACNDEFEVGLGECGSMTRDLWPGGGPHVDEQVLSLDVSKIPHLALERFDQDRSVTDQKADAAKRATLALSSNGPQWKRAAQATELPQKATPTPLDVHGFVPVMPAEFIAG